MKTNRRISKPVFVRRMQTLEASIRQAYKEKEELREAYFLSHCKYRIGEKVRILDPHTKEPIAVGFLRQIFVGEDGEFRYRCYRSNKRGEPVKSHFRYDEKNSLTENIQIAKYSEEDDLVELDSDFDI